MGPKDDASAKPAEIGNALVEKLGFEPADSKKLGRNAVADVSEQLSDAGFTVTDALGDDDSDAASADSALGDSALSDTASGNGSNTSRKSTKSGGGSNGTSADADATAESNGSKGSSKSKKARSKARSSEKSGSGSDSSSGIDDAKAAADAELKRILDSDPNDTVVMPGPPADEVAAASGGVTSASASAKAKDKDELVESLVSAGTMAGAAAPTSPPVVDDAADQVAVAKSDVDVRVDPAITGETPAVPEFDSEQVHLPRDGAQRIENRTIIEKPRSVSDMFSGGITGRRRLQARKVRRVIRHIDPWSVLTFSVLFHLCLFAALLLASVLVWNVADEAGTIENVESFIRELGDYETFEIDGEAIFRAAVAIAGIMTLAASVLVVLLTVMFNLLSDLLGGVRVTVIEEETVRIKPKKGER